MSDGDYVLGTESAEIERLRLQHEVWRAQAVEGWARARISAGMTVIDVGAGPGFATMDLAEQVGSRGRVIALERSRRFLDALKMEAKRRGAANVEAREHDVSADAFGEAIADMAWCRWVLSFVTDPEAAVRHIVRALRPGAVAIFHEYADYGSWRLLPPNPDQQRFRTLVEQSWRDSGGEPDAALGLPALLSAAGMELVGVRPLIRIISRSDPMWRWPESFMAVNAARLCELGYASEEEADRFASALDRSPDHALMITPLVAEVIARKP